MIVDALRYPFGNDRGRTALRRSVVCVVAVAVGVRYAAALSPTVVALVPALVALLGAVTLLGTTAFVLGPDDERSTPSAGATARFGVGALALSIAFFVPSLLLLAQSVLETPAQLALGDGTGPFALVFSTLSIFFFAACAYVYPAAVAATVSTGRLRAALEADALGPALTDPAYFLRWTVGFSLAVPAAWFVLVSVRRGDALGLLAAAVAAYLLVAGARAVGGGYARATGAIGR